MSETTIDQSGGEPPDKPDKSEKKEGAPSHFHSAQISPAVANYVFTNKIGLRFGRQVSGGAGYCLSDVFTEGVTTPNAIQVAKTQAGMGKSPDHAGWTGWKIRLWDCCAFGLSLGAEAGTAFLFAKATPLASGDRYPPVGETVTSNPVWKTGANVTKTFVKVNSVPDGTPVLATINYNPAVFSEEAVDALYGAIIQELTRLAGG